MEITSEVAKTNVEHLREYDLLINTRQETISLAELEALVMKLKTDAEKNENGDPIKEWTVSDEHYRFSIDNPGNPKFGAKKKWIEPDEWLNEAIDIHRPTAYPDELEMKKRRYATDSIMNEMALNKEVEKIVNSEEVQELFRDFGIEHVDYIEPLVGLINRYTGEKTIIYKYSNGISFSSYINESEFTEDKIYLAIKKLIEVFKKNNIEPYDLDTRQFIVESHNGKNFLKLIDTEMYYRI